MATKKVKSGFNYDEKEQTIVLTTRFPRIGNFTNVLKVGSLAVIGLAFLVFLFFTATNVFMVITPHFITTTSVSTDQLVNYTPDIYQLSIYVINESENRSFGDINTRLNNIKTYLAPYWKLKPSITPSEYKTSYYRNQTRFEKYRLQYTITGQLKTVNLDWDKLISNVDYLNLNFRISPDVRQKMKEDSDNLARKKLDAKADVDGKQMFLIYLGKQFKSSYKSCGGDSNYKEYGYVSKSAPIIGLGSEVSANSAPVQVGIESGTCQVYATYTLYGVNFGGFE